MESLLETVSTKKLQELQARLYQELPATFHFNSYKRYEEVIAFCELAAKEYSIPENELLSMRMVVLSLFKGLLVHYTNFHLAAMRYVEDTFKELSNEQLTLLKKMIKAIDTGGTTLPENILHDAWWSFVGKKKFSEKVELLMLEKVNHAHRIYAAGEWEKERVDIIAHVKFYTKFANETLSKRRKKNLLKVSEDWKGTKNQKKGRGIETMYRAVYRNHINLSSIADAKANMMISINTIIMSVIITGVTGFSFTSNLMMQKLQYVIPVFVLLLASLVSVVFAIISARPEVTSKKLKVEKIKKKESSYLFFGNFVKMKLASFIKRLGFYRNNQSALYDDMSIDIYYLGQVLDRKYKLLRIAYNIFMIGLILSVLSFIAVMVYVKIIA